VPGNEIILSVEKLSKVYKREVLNVKKLSFQKGKIYGLIGPSGAGKSTLLRLVNLLEEPTTGSIFFQGQKISKSEHMGTAVQQEMTMVFQKPLLFNATVGENIAYGLKARRIKKEEIQKKVTVLLGKIGLAEFAGRKAITLSGGEAQRVALARAVAFEPSLLLLDEPTANLDPFNVELLEKLIMDLNRDAGMTIILVTHNIFQARRVAQEIIFLYGGRIVEQGGVEKIFSSPKDPRTRAFIEGQMVY
jgi:tungstate transport system ATP-binding protein